MGSLAFCVTTFVATCQPINGCLCVCCVCLCVFCECWCARCACQATRSVRVSLQGHSSCRCVRMQRLSPPKLSPKKARSHKASEGAMLGGRNTAITPRPCHGCIRVAISHRVTPNAKTSDFSVTRTSCPTASPQPICASVVCSMYLELLGRHECRGSLEARL